MPLCPAVLIFVKNMDLLRNLLVWKCSRCDRIAFYLFRFRHHVVMENGRQITPTKSGNNYFSCRRIASPQKEQRTALVGTLMLVRARQRYVVGTQWGNKKHMNIYLGYYDLSWSMYSSKHSPCSCISCAASTPTYL